MGLVRHQAAGHPLQIFYQGKIILPTQRAGSTSIINSIGWAKWVAPQWVHGQRHLRRIMWVREPWDRLASATMIQGNRNYELWIESTVLGSDDAHYAPQTFTHSYYGVPLWDTVYRFEDFRESWALEFPGTELKHKRHNPERITGQELKQLLPPSMVEAINDFYKDDIELYEHTSKLAP